MHRNIRLLYIFNFLTDFKLWAAVAVLIFSRESGSYLGGMAVFSVMTLSSALFEIPTGLISDHFGRKAGIISGAASALTGSLFFALDNGYASLLVGAAFFGLSASIYSGNNDAFLYDFLKSRGEQKEYAHYLGRVSSMFQLALAISAVAGGILASVSYSLVMWLSVIPQLGCFIIAFFFEDTAVDTRRKDPLLQLRAAFREFRRNPVLRKISSASVIGHSFGEAGYQFQAAFFATLWPVWAIGIAKTLANLGAAVSFHYSGRITRRFGRLKSVIFTRLAGRGLHAAALLLAGPVSPLLIASTSLMFGVQTVGENSLQQDEFSPRQRATMGSIVSLAGSAVFALASLLLGWLGDLLGIINAYLLLQAVLLIPAWMLYRVYRGRSSAAEDKAEKIRR
ncbi:MFS transporter [Salinispira pacifica]|uniref:MFS transporter n=1 Tax=Salinispira pacifica TaxID=1307761 RepID=UPI001FCC0830|nr:MFS transporter [Salinispira pacifica]